LHPNGITHHRRERPSPSQNDLFDQRGVAFCALKRPGGYSTRTCVFAGHAQPDTQPNRHDEGRNEHLANALRLEVGNLGVSVGVAHMSWINTAMVRDTKAD
jgi:hypothetical protein